jgi:N4-(beta-N-acetylglucosaminyl)-L-asparaginase
MLNRRKFIQFTGFTGLATLLGKEGWSNAPGAGLKGKPIVISTWGSNVRANSEAWTLLAAGKPAIDAVVAGVQIPEANPRDNSVGFGGLPDRDGHVTLDSCVMDHKGRCGAVMALEHIMHPVLVAKAVMEQTPHVQLVGEGALRFALSLGMKKENLLTPESEKIWKDWLKNSRYDPMDTLKEFEKANKKESEPYPWPSPVLNHDTIGMVALDNEGNLGGACTTSGMAFKMNGRVGDSPIIGAGLFVDNEVGAASATGVGEEVVKVCGAHTIIESMRRGLTPEAACREAIRRIVKNKGAEAKNVQVGFLAINNKGQHGGFAINKNFTYAVTTKEGTKVVTAKSWYDK